MSNYDLTDAEYKIIEPLLPPERGKPGCPCKPHRPIINGILWVLRSGASWRELPERYGIWGSVHIRYSRWKRDGTWEKIYNALSKKKIKDEHRSKKNKGAKPPYKKAVSAQTRKKDSQQSLASIDEWESEFSEVACRLASCFTRCQSRHQVMAYLKGLLSPAERKNSWQLAEINGDKDPYAIQYLLSRARWDSDALRDELYIYAKDNIESPQAVVVIDETGFLKKGIHSAGVARQYSGTAGRVENCQIGVFATYASPLGHVLLDRELYLPKQWTDNPTRCQKAGIPADKKFATKPQLAREMLERIFSADIKVSWVTGDSVYGDNRRLRVFLQNNKRPYVLAVSGKEYVCEDGQQRKVNSILKNLPTESWRRISAGDGAKGPRFYDWMWLPLESVPQPGWCQWLLVRRTISDPNDLTAYVVFGPQITSLEQAVQVAGIRWTTETNFQAGKGEVGLDHYEVRSWIGWYRHITLAMWAYALLVVIRAKTSHDVEPIVKKKSSSIRKSSLAMFKNRRGL